MWRSGWKRQVDHKRRAVIRLVISTRRYFSLGARGERAAKRFLERRGYIIRHRNWRCKLGELDIVAQQGPCLVFVEVKTRRAEIARDFIPEEAVDERKEKKLHTLCLAYWQEFERDIRYRRLRQVRLDIIAVEAAPPPKRSRIRHRTLALLRPPPERG